MKSQEPNKQRHNDSGSFSEMGWAGHYGKGLSRRETQFLILVAACITTNQIARRFDLSPCTVENRHDDTRLY
ncbi:LuxR C-terminal-related transcriptional regulator, partial [Pseudomonas syringae pv. tagetis]|uniref:LuxR C-terminal-related transcriptional regulator n=1 Tax=Pseudomonas syringae group genomosp. 7 TaxID=251699 RepID=UPI00377038EE